MATYSNQHWLLSHIRNSFISTDDTGMCETVMLSDDLPKHFLRKFQTSSVPRKLSGNGNCNGFRNLDLPLQETEFICYPGLDQSDEEDIDLSSQSFDIQMFPEVGAHRLRSNTAQKLEKMDIARRKAARTKSVNYDDEIVPPENSDFFVRKPVITTDNHILNDKCTKTNELVEPSNNLKSILSLQLANSPKQIQNRFMEYARFDGTSQTEFQTKRINVFLSMLPERERNYPIKICVLASAKIIEVIGLVCYKATIQYPDIPLKSIRHYALYMTEDNDEMEDFPPLDNREPCSKFGFSHLTLAERRPLAPVTRVDYHSNLPTKSMTSEEDKARLAAAAVRSLQGIDPNGGGIDSSDQLPGEVNVEDQISEYESRILDYDDMLEASLYRTFRLNIIEKPFFKTEVTLGISSERFELEHHKNAKFWMKQKAVTYPIDSIAHCEVLEQRQIKAILRIWIKSASSSLSSSNSASSPNSGNHVDSKLACLFTSGSGAASSSTSTHSPNSPSHYQHLTQFTLFPSSASSSNQQPIMRFKHYDFEADIHTAEQILNKLNCILRVRCSDIRREFLQQRERKLEKHNSKKQLKM